MAMVGTLRSAISYLSSWEEIVNTIVRNNNRRVCVWLIFFTNLFELHVGAAHVLGAGITASASSYNFIAIDLPTPGGLLGFTTLADINENGAITGGFTDSNLGPYGFILDDVRSTDIRCSKAVLSTAPQAINKHGEIAGFATVATYNFEIPFEIAALRTSGFFRDKEGRCTILDFPGANLTEASGVNDDGQVVGNYRDAAGNFHGFFWDAGLFVTIDVPFPDATITGPTAINNIGQIVGFYFDNNGRVHGFLYENGSFTAFDFPKAVDTLPADINDHGQIVGSYVDGNFVGRSFLLENGTFTIFNVPFIEVFASRVSGINNKGQIVGTYLEDNSGDPVNPFPSRGFIANPKLDLNLIAQRP